MDKDQYIKLTFALFRVLELLPEKETKQRIEESAKNILAGLILLSYGNPILSFSQRESITPQILKEIAKLTSYFDSAESSQRINPQNFLVLKKEYDKISQELKSKLLSPEFGIRKQEDRSASNNRINSGLRKEKILNISNGSGKVKVGDLLKVFPQLNRRTLLRDLESLVQIGSMERKGNGRGTCYYAINRT